MQRVHEAADVDDGAGFDDGEVGEGGLAEETAADFGGDGVVVGGGFVVGGFVGGFVVGFVVVIVGFVSGSGSGKGRLRAEIEFVEDGAVGVAAGFADFAFRAVGEGEEDGVAFGGDGDARAEFANVA